MKKNLNPLLLSALLLSLLSPVLRADSIGESYVNEPAEVKDARMEWWRDARFGMFIHWGLYAIPAGEWNGKTHYAEWIRTRAQIPGETYDQFVGQFNPVNFDADAWVKMARAAGMKYIVITSKHHDGFCLWPSDQTEYDVTSTPFKRDILAELSQACKKHGVRMCFYHSVMDWHHPDYLPRRKWEKNRPTEGADYERYVTYMKAQLKELIVRYDPGVLWFDGEWESTWTHDHGKELYDYVRSLKPDIIINNRVDKGRRGMHGMTKEGEFRGDFGTPEQEIPATGIPGVDWESCMTMNGKWGWSQHDKRWKSDTDLIRKLVDITSKGGNFLLNIGPKADGTFPDESIARLESMGKWMDVHGESVYETTASPFGNLSWGRCTVKDLGQNKTRLYLHLFEWPKSGKIDLPMLNPVQSAKVMGSNAEVAVKAGDFGSQLTLPGAATNPHVTVVEVDIPGTPKLFTADPYKNETAEERDARMKWWREARFGMFIHWGVYSVPAGTYEGKQIAGIGEWIMRRANIPVDTYRGYAKEFNPVKYDADAWVRLAKEAGMKYIVITAKHHDGFALFDSKVTDWDIANATPYGKDLLRPLVEACKKHGLKIGFYYSQAQDWTHPGGAKAGMKEGQGWDEKHKGDYDEYLANIAYPQVKEILSGYDIDVLWWDTPTWMNTARAEKLAPLLYLRPGIIHNNRLGGGFRGDTDTPEQHIPATGMPGRDWETCMTLNGTWGYKSYDHNWKPTQKLVRNLIDIASKGGNYLLNVGPTREGLIPEPSIERLKEVGQWMRVNGASIYETSASPFAKLTWGRCTKKLNAHGATLYLHVFDWPADGKLQVPGLMNPVSTATLLATGQKLGVAQGEEGVTLSLPDAAPDAIASVIVLEVQGDLEIVKALIKPAEDASITLPAMLADLHNPGHGDPAKIEDKYGAPSIGYWLDARAWVAWQFKADQTGTYEVVADVAGLSDSKVTIEVDGKKITATVKKTGSYEKFQAQVLGKIQLTKPGKQQLSIRPVKDGWQPINLKTVILRPAP